MTYIVDGLKKNKLRKAPSGFNGIKTVVMWNWIDVYFILLF